MPNWLVSLMKMRCMDYNSLLKKWPKTVILSFKNESIKNKIYMEGLDIFNRHIELQDCSETAVIKVIVYDAPVGMTNDKLREILSGYGDVINVEEEMHTFNGRVTSWSTGNRLVNMTNQKIHSTYDWSVQGATNFNQYLVSRARWKKRGEHLLLRSNGVFSVAQLIM